MLHRSESLLTLWQHHSLSILWCNTKTGLSRNNRQCYGKSYRTEPQNISVPEMHKNTVHMFLKRGMIVIQPFRWIGMQNTNLSTMFLSGFSRISIRLSRHNCYHLEYKYSENGLINHEKSPDGKFTNLWIMILLKSKTSQPRYLWEKIRKKGKSPSLW